MHELLGEEFSAFQSSMASVAPTAVRLNPMKRSDRFASSSVIPWCKDGRQLKERPVFTLDPLFHAGCYYVQEANSMYIEQAVSKFMKTERVRLVLDLCAAPGGKSTHLRSILPDDAVLVANEVVPSRNHVLCENLSKWGHPGCIVTRNSMESLTNATGNFDVVLVDAPCSGEGLFRRDPDAVKEWSTESVTACSVRQKTILDVAAALVRPGGLLLYSTCTWSKEEDEQVVADFLGRHAFKSFEVPVHTGILHTDFGLRFYPHRTLGEGFFLSAMIKDDSADQGGRRNHRSGPSVGRSTDSKILPKSFGHMQGFECYTIHDTIWAYPEQVLDVLPLISSIFHIVYAGCKVGSLKGQDLMPSQESAQCPTLFPEAPYVRLQEQQALQYLRGEALTGTHDLKGWLKAEYEGHALGWVKAVNGRFNNGYPKERRIRMNIPSGN